MSMCGEHERNEMLCFKPTGERLNKLQDLSMYMNSQLSLPPVWTPKVSVGNQLVILISVIFNVAIQQCLTLCPFLNKVIL